MITGKKKVPILSMHKAPVKELATGVGGRSPGPVSLEGWDLLL